MARGVKRCPECGSDVRTAVKTCYCGYQFYTVRKPRIKGNVVDWRELEPGDRVRIISTDRWERGEKVVRMGHKGIFTVVEVTDTGLFLHNIRGCCFQSMTENGTSPNNIQREIPTIVKVCAK